MMQYKETVHNIAFYLIALLCIFEAIRQIFLQSKWQNVIGKIQKQISDYKVEFSLLDS